MANPRLVTATVIDENQWTDSIRLSGAFDLSIAGSAYQASLGPQPIQADVVE